MSYHPLLRLVIGEHMRTSQNETQIITNHSDICPYFGINRKLHCGYTKKLFRSPLQTMKAMNIKRNHAFFYVIRSVDVNLLIF